MHTCTHAPLAPWLTDHVLCINLKLYRASFWIRKIRLSDGGLTQANSDFSWDVSIF